LKYNLVLAFTLSWLSVFAQVKEKDSTKILKEIVVTTVSFTTDDPLRATSATGYIGEAEKKNQQQNSLVGSLNTLAGVRMEERSPGSYRLSLRGSLLRSPFGIRNVKIYINDFPLTDAGGNTYLNLIDAGLISSMTILKGPQASIFGANTGGAILINTPLSPDNFKEISLTAGSYSSFHQTFKIKQRFENYNLTINEGYQQSDGYRENSALKRKYIQTSHKWIYSENGFLSISAFYSDLAYKTPGGLTEAQMLANLEAARPATPTIPSAKTQQAGIYNRTFFGGLSNTYYISPNLKWIVAAFGSVTDFKNPFITNYEKRKENTIGIRSFINYKSYKNQDFKLDTYLGVENSRTASSINNYGNDRGVASALQSSDDLTAKQTFAFVKFNLELYDRLFIELGSSLNFYDYTYQSYFPVAIAKQQLNFKAQLMPKIAASYLITQNLSFRSSISKGYSPPTIAEVRASDQIINSNLQAEAGWNYESGFHLQAIGNRLTLDVSLFNFDLKNAIVRRLTPSDAEYFVNAGGTKQLGTELQVSWIVLQGNNRRFLDEINISSSYTYSHFRFKDFKNAAQDFSGNKLTGVPQGTIVSGLELIFVKGFFIFAQHNYTSTIPLNDANTVYSKKYHLADLKAGIRSLLISKQSSTKFDVSFDINNVFNRSYSLGNDLNAVNNRYYNPAAKRNYSVSLGLRF
jgi:iron complex outermembrane receptor protein